MFSRLEENTAEEAQVRARALTTGSSLCELMAAAAERCLDRSTGAGREEPAHQIAWPAPMTRPEFKAITSQDYFELGGLLGSVESGAIAPLKGSWIVKLHAAGGRLKRRQDMPAEAYWTAAELRVVALELGEKFGLLFVALSYRWLSKEHPDPDGFHLDIVASVAKLYLGLSGKNASESPLVEAFSSLQTDADFALFWDFPSLCQPPRSEAEAALFKRGLKLSNVWYGHAHSVCWMQSELPSGFNGAAYEKSGWCYVEAAISAAVKVGLNRLDLGKRTEKALGFCYGSESVVPDMRLDCTCAGNRLPPPAPEYVRDQLDTDKVFTTRADVALVADLYRSFFDTVASSVEHMDVRNLSWGDSEAELLCAVLPRFRRLKMIE